MHEVGMSEFSCLFQCMVLTYVCTWLTYDVPHVFPMIRANGTVIVGMLIDVD